MKEREYKNQTLYNASGTSLILISTPTFSFMNESILVLSFPDPLFPISLYMYIYLERINLTDKWCTSYLQ